MIICGFHGIECEFYNSQQNSCFALVENEPQEFPSYCPDTKDKVFMAKIQPIINWLKTERIEKCL